MQKVRKSSQLHWEKSFAGVYYQANSACCPIVLMLYTQEPMRSQEPSGLSQSSAPRLRLTTNTAITPRTEKRNSVVHLQVHP